MGAFWPELNWLENFLKISESKCLIQRVDICIYVYIIRTRNDEVERVRGGKLRESLVIITIYAVSVLDTIG